MRWVLLAIGCVFVPLVAPAAAQAPSTPAVALVLDVSGGRIAGIEPFREIATDTTVSIPPGVSLVAQHYGACRRITVTGGVAAFRADGVDVSGGGRRSDIPAACPRKVALKADGASAAVTMRSLGPPPITIGLRPEFVVVGPRAGEVAAVRVRRGSEIVVEQPVRVAQPFRWPADAPPLTAETSYELELLPAAGGRGSVAIRLRTGSSSSTSEALTLLHAE